jgi:hypothetical protein
MHLEQSHDDKVVSGKGTPDAVVQDERAGSRADVVPSAGSPRVTRPDYVQIHRENQRRIWDAKNEPEKKRSRREARDRMRVYHGKTAETVRPYLKLDEFTPEEKKARKRLQDREARARYNAKPRPALSLEEENDIADILAGLEPKT